MVYNFAPLILTDMLTREQIEEIQGEAREKGTAIKALLKEKGIPEHQYFWWKRKYARAEVPDGFLPIAGGGLPAGMEATAAFAASRGKRRVSRPVRTG